MRILPVSIIILILALSFAAATPVHAQYECANINEDNVSLTGTLIGGAWEVGVSTIYGSSKSGADLNNAIAATLCNPTPRIRIPGLTFTSIDDIVASAFKGDDGALYIQIPYLGEYISAIYRYSFIIMTVIATLMMVVAGIQWISSGGNQEGISEAKKRITQSAIGLLILATSFLLLYTLDPTLTKFKPLSIQLVQEEIVEYDGIYDLAPGVTGGSGKLPAEVKLPTEAIPSSFGWSDNPMEALIGPLPSVYLPCSSTAALEAAQKLYERSICTGPCHCNYAARHLLTYLGCANVPQEGSANGMKDLAIKAGWKEVAIRDIDPAEHPIGLLWTDGHVGVYLGVDGTGTQYQFDSGARRGAGAYGTAGTIAATCPASGKFYDIDPADPTKNCAGCSMIPSAAPATGRHGAASKSNLGLGKVIGTNGGDTCISIQTWEKKTLNTRLWKKLYVPENATL